MMPSRQDAVFSNAPEENYAVPFKEGESLPSALMRAFAEDFAKMGGQALALLRTKHPQDYVKIILSLQSSANSKEATSNDVDEEERRLILMAAREALAAHQDA
jgi:hypothetical protein